MYFEFDDVRRIHQPYTDNYTRGKPPNTNLTTPSSTDLEATNL